MQLHKKPSLLIGKAHSQVIMLLGWVKPCSFSTILSSWSTCCSPDHHHLNPLFTTENWLQVFPKLITLNILQSNYHASYWSRFCFSQIIPVSPLKPASCPGSDKETTENSLQVVHPQTTPFQIFNPLLRCIIMVTHTQSFYA